MTPTEAIALLRERAVLNPGGKLVRWRCAALRREVTNEHDER